MLRLYNSLSRQLEDFAPISPPNVGLYSCGPTVYDYAHIGHLRAYVFVDTLKRVLTYNGFNVRHVMNITDVGHLTSDADTGEDKIEVGARREGKSAWDIAKFYEDDFWQATGALNILRPDFSPRATDHIKEQIDMVKKIEAKGLAYKIEDGIYFDSAQFPAYGELAWGKEGLPAGRQGIKPGARVKLVPGKKNPTDFALWKFSPKGKKRQMEWDSPWVHPEGSPRGGRGFPGWHIECSAMGIKYLGENFDIHTGGVDHIPTHHTNEIAQNQTATGHKVVNFWLHNEHLLVEGARMSKSAGNFLRLADIVKKGFDPLALRYLILGAHYRTQLNFTWKGLEGAQSSLEKLRQLVAEFGVEKERTALSPEKLAKIDQWRQKFLGAINNDLGTPEALAVVWELVKSNVPGYDKFELIRDWDEVLGLGLGKVSEVSQASKVPKEVDALVEERERLRREDKWDEADKIRQKILKAGFEIEDSDAGPKLKPARRKVKKG